MYAKVKIRGHFSSEFEDNKGLRQEYKISPLLLNIVSKTAITLSKVETQRNILAKCSEILAYDDDDDDDVFLMGRRLQNIEEVFTPRVKQTNKTGL